LEGLEGLTFEPAQYTALARLGDEVASRYPIAAVTGHEDISPGRKGDPGSGFSWALLQAQLQRDDLRVGGVTVGGQKKDTG
ncbi:MAG: N-acetylmuramoyl-L-alanine amidase, partial [Pseudomonadota bacterium]|nr:N-acetylmuramoyl-L-alanine amidase [Pseudomonadota bacterium]